MAFALCRKRSGSHTPPEDRGANLLASG
jgi:hypothetical protein